MTTRRQERVSSFLEHITASFLQREADFGSAIVALTHIEISPDLKFAKVFVSVFPEKEEKNVTRVLNTFKKDLRLYISKNSRAKFMPEFTFLIDESEKKRKEIEERLMEI